MDLDNHYCILLPIMNPSNFKFFNLVNFTQSYSCFSYRFLTTKRVLVSCRNTVKQASGGF